MTKSQAEYYRAELAKAGYQGFVERIVLNRLSGYAIKIGSKYITEIEQAKKLAEGAA